MLKEIHPEFAVDKSEIAQDFDLTLNINTADMPKTMKVSKSMSEEEQKTVREQNEQIRQERQELCDKITTKVSKIKRDFMGAPIRRAIKACAEGQKFEPCEIPYRPLEKYWIVCPDPGQMTVIFSIHFESQDDQALARVMLLEFQGAMRKVKQSIAVRYHDKELPTQLAQNFPNVKADQYSNGFITLRKYSIQCQLTSYCVYRIPGQSAFEEQGYGPDYYFHDWIQTVHPLPLAWNQIDTAQADAQKGRVIRESHQSGQTRSGRTQKLERAENRTILIRQRAWRRGGEEGRGLCSQEVRNTFGMDHNQLGHLNTLSMFAF